MKTEAETRVKLIDTKLKTAGWDVTDRSQVSQEFDISVSLLDGVTEPRTPYEGHQFSDYVLLGRDGKPLAVIENELICQLDPSEFDLIPDYIIAECDRYVNEN
jgi:type I restriction enzyme R subunit